MLSLHRRWVWGDTSQRSPRVLQARLWELLGMGRAGDVSQLRLRAQPPQLISCCSAAVRCGGVEIDFTHTVLRC